MNRTKNGEPTIAQVGTYNGNERPSSYQLIADLKKSFKAKIEDYKAVAIFYDVRVVDPKTNLKTDAVAVFVEKKIEDNAYIFYYPYILTTQKELTFSESWQNDTPKEIFLPS